MSYMIMPLYNTEAPVGKCKPNQADDVRLVQTLLREISRVSRWNPGYSLGALGRYSDSLGDWIHAFQQRVNRGMPSRVVYEDSIIDPIPAIGHSLTKPRMRSGRYSSLYFMNLVLRAYSRTGHTNVAGMLDIAEKTPTLEPPTPSPGELIDL